MKRARDHRRLAACGAFLLLAFVAELVGRSLTHRLDVGARIGTPTRYARSDYYPFLLAIVKVAVALMLAGVAWRFAKARASARAGRRLLAAAGKRPSRPVPRVRLELSPRLWAGSFAATALFYLVQTDLERISTGEWPLLAPWLHTSALPVFAVLAVLVALLYRGAARWLAEYEIYAHETVAYAYARACGPGPPPPRRRREAALAPRFLFGLAFESRPPPAAA